MPLAHAACTNPAAGEGALIYNGDQHVMQYCSGTIWIGMAGGVASGFAETDPKVGTLTSNKWCTSNAGGTAIVCNQNAPSGAASNGATGLVQFSDGAGGFLSDSTAGGEFFWDATNHRLGIGTATPNASALLDVTSTSKGFLPPRMLTAEVTAIASPADGLIVYDTDTDTIKLRANGAWVSLQAGAGAESDPQVGTLTASKWCAANVGGTAIDCTADAPATGAAGAASEVQFRNSGTGAFAADSSFVWDDSNNRLGIGTTGALTTKFEVHGTDSFTQARVHEWSNDTATSFFTGAKSRGAVVGTHATVLANDTLTTFAGVGSDGTAFSAAAKLQVEVDGAPAASDIPGRLTFFTKPSGAAMVERMRITSTGNVGIGTTGPTRALDVVGSFGVKASASGSEATFDTVTAGQTFGLVWKDNGAAKWQMYKDSAHTFGLYDYTRSAAVLSIGANGSMALMPVSGNVGIGTIAPAEKLHVAGTGNVLSIIESTDNSAVQLRLKTNSTNRRLVALNSSDTTESQIILDDDGAFGFYGPLITDVRMNILANGFVGIGAVAPGYKLDVGGAGATGAYSRLGGMSILTADAGFEWWTGSYTATGPWQLIRRNISTAAWTNPLTVTTAGNVGIGTTSPSSFGKLAVTVGNGSTVGVTTSSGASGAAGGFQLNSYYGSVKIGYIDNELVDGTSGSEKSLLRFATIKNGTLTEAMRIDNSGNVGIGTVSPNARLEVSSATDTSVRITSTGAGGRIWGLQSSQSGYPGTLQIVDWTAAVARFAIDTSGNVGIGTAAPKGVLNVVGIWAQNVSPAQIMVSNNSSASMGLAGIGFRPYGDSDNNPWMLYAYDSSQSNRFCLGKNGVNEPLCLYPNGTWTTPSDRRLKTNIEPVADSLAKIDKLNGVYFDWKDPKMKGKGRQLGLIAQDVEAVFPDLVETGWKDYKTLNYNGLIAPMVEAIKELKSDNDNLRAEIKAANDNLRAIVEEQGREIEQLKQTR